MENLSFAFIRAKLGVFKELLTFPKLDADEYAASI